MHRLFLFILLSVSVHAASFRDEFRLGKVTDFQGVAAVRPELGKRWTPVEKGMVLRKGDWLRTDVRGANAVQVKLPEGGQCILGPGGLVEFLEKGEVKLIRGELEVAPPKDGVVKLEYGEHSVKVKERGVYRQSDAKVYTGLLPKDPNWLQGFKGVITTESMGSLLANVEGRSTPLTIGYHKVSVDIRDQIARTTIEESFVNHTDSRLEGVFYFPLPQDASIAGFGMWINGELVEADVVEKQRAREIYETILRERRDPGLLEWNGGNIFKARVFPIFGHSEKRIKITYTQVLPMRKGKVRYSYALESEMLKVNPLRELAINVRVHSAIPIKSAICPTHEVRFTKTKYAVQAEFTAQEYTPSSDLEIELELDAKESPVTIIPHQRGEDGYFLALIQSPESEAGWSRDLIRDGKPLDLLILADTSGSMREEDRERQDALIGALLGSLAEQDTFRVAACDVKVNFFKQEPLAATDQHINNARDFLNQQLSLGWSDLDNTFAKALQHAKTGTQVIYIGDGVIANQETDPIAFNNRLKQQYSEAEKEVTFHAIAPGSSFESLVLKTLASLGGGSVRQIGGSNTPSAVARQLLLEMANPGLKDLKIEFNGIRTARVYPEQLPNLQRGTQQIVIGRYLPKGKNQKGELVVSGLDGGKEVQFRTPISLADAESGNSFIPRLWARKHLDYLLEQGRSAAIKEDIIALSEEFHIMTPYTSFLVLESDADRERFGVKRRFQMRDGEKFFAEGRDQATLELLRKQMKQAGTWRLQLQRSILQQLARMGRGVQVRQQNYYPGAVPGGKKSKEVWFDDYEGLTADTEPVDRQAEMEPGDFAKNREDFQESSNESLGESLPVEELEEANEMIQSGPVPSAPSPDPSPEPVVNENFLADEMDMDLSFAQSARRGNFAYGSDRLKGDKLVAMDVLYGAGDYAEGAAAPGYGYAYHPMQGLHPLFPPVPTFQSYDNVVTDNWPKEAKKVAETLLKWDVLRKEPVVIRIKQQSYSIPEEELTREQVSKSLFTKGGWITSEEDLLNSLKVGWSDKDATGVIDNSFELVRFRPSVPSDQYYYPEYFQDGSFQPLMARHPNGKITIEKIRNHQVAITADHSTDKNTNKSRYLIDTRRNVLLQYTHTGANDEVTNTTTYKKFFKHGGVWWAGQVDTQNKDGQLVYRRVFEANVPEEQEVEQAFADLNKLRKKAIFLKESLPSLEEAKQQLLDGNPTLSAHIVLLQHFAASQQWEKCDEHFSAIEELSGLPKPIRWLQLRYALMKRRSEDVFHSGMELAKEIAANPDMHPDSAYRLAYHIRTEVAQRAQAAEFLELLNVLKPVYERAINQPEAMQQWETDRLNYLRSAGHTEEAMKFHKILADKYPKQHGLNYARQIAYQLSDTEEGMAYMNKLLAIAKKQNWDGWRIEQIHTAKIDLLEQKGAFPRALEIYEDLLDRKPDPQHNWIYNRYLNALIRTNQVERCFEEAQTWLVGEDTAKIGAAVYIVVNRQVIPEEFHEPLAKVVRRYALDEQHNHLASTIMTNYRFYRTDIVRTLRAEFWEQLLSDADSMQLPNMQRLLGWVEANDPVVEKESWKALTDKLEHRWSQEEEINERNQLGYLVARLLSSHGTPDTHLAFLRRQKDINCPTYGHHYRHLLFQAILSRPWTQCLEDENWELLYTLDPNGENLRSQFEQLVNWITSKKYAALAEAIPKKEELSRTALKGAKLEKLKQVRTELVDRLENELKTAPEKLQPWIQADKLYFQVFIRKDLEQVAAKCWEYLDSSPIEGEKKPTQEEAILYNRFLTTLEYLAVRPGGDRKIAEDLLKMYSDSIEKNPEDNMAWKYKKYKLLVVLDRPEQLAETLASWIKPGKADNTWRRTLGIIYAELNRIPDAIDQFETITETDELKPTDWRTLADWYLVNNQKDKREDALTRALMTEPEHVLSQKVYRYRDQIRNDYSQNQGTPEDLDPEIIRVFTALMKKSPNPTNYTYYLAQIYKDTKDFRLLKCMPEGVIGHTKQSIYPFLQNLHSVLQHIRDEAVVDQINTHLVELREMELTETDSRALHLLTMLIERKASEVLNQPGPHTVAALASMKAAFKGEWEDGEPLQMARLLAGMGVISQELLSREQLRQLKALQKLEEEGTFAHLQLSEQLARTIWNYSKYDEALEILSIALDAYREAHNGRLQTNAQGMFSTLNSWLRSRKYFAKAEKEILDEIARQSSEAMIRWLKQLKYNTWMDAFRADATVSIGSGKTLYRNMQKTLLDAIREDREQNFRYNVIYQLCNLYREAYQHKKYSEPKEDLDSFAFGLLAEILKTQQNNYNSLVNHVADQINYISGPKPGLAYLIHSYENVPEWVQQSHNTAWQMFGYKIAYWRHLAKDIGDQDPRLLKIVLKELRRDLEDRRSYNRYIYDKGSYFWGEHEARYLELSEEIYQERKDSGQSIVYIASYLWNGLKVHERAIEILEDAHGRELLDENGQTTLLGYHESQKNYDRAIELLVHLIDWRPDNLNYRTRLMQHYKRQNQLDKLVQLLDVTEQFLREKNRWNEHSLSHLGSVCVSTNLWERAVTYYKELIPLHQRTHAQRGIGNGTLSSYYNYLSRAYTALDDTIHAVEAASGAIVSWGSTHSNRNSAIQSLYQVLAESKDLDAYMVHLNKEVEESGLENPIIRKQLGKVMVERHRRYEDAIPNLKIAVELQPNDLETHRLLINAFDKLDQPLKAIHQTLEAARINRQEFKFYEDLANRYEKLENLDLAERARTSIVETLPTEAESHQLLAEIRQKQDRWEDAIPHWRQVAEIRSLEPTGLMGLANAQLQAGKKDQARHTIDRLVEKNWPQRFRNIHEQAKRLLKN